MSTWPNKSILKSSNVWRMPAHLKNPPKGKDPAIRESWKKERSDFRREKLLVLGLLPKSMALSS